MTLLVIHVKGMKTIQFLIKILRYAVILVFLFIFYLILIAYTYTLKTAPVPNIPAVENQNDLLDIASFIKKRSLQESEIIACLKFTWEPPLSFTFPVQIEGNRTRKFQHRYLQLFPWLAYIKDKQGAFCKWCVVFTTSGGGVGNQV